MRAPWQSSSRSSAGCTGQPFQSDPLKEREFLLFDSDLGWLATIKVPEALAVREITPDFIVLTATDELGVSRVVVHRILKPVQDTEVTG